MRRILLWGTLAILAAGLAVAGWAYFQAMDPNVADRKTPYALRIPHGVGFDYVMAELKASGAIQNLGSFERVARFRKYDQLVKPGLYYFKPGMNNWNLVGKLRSGDQDQMKLTFKSHRSLDEIADEIGGQMEFGKDALEKRLRDDDYLASYGFNATTVRGLFIPDTYFIYWTLGIDEFFKKMKRNYDAFWTDARKAKAEELGMSQAEVITLASIVQAETYMSSERPTVAGLYLNRLQDGIPLQADPTVIFAHQDWTIRRLLFSHLEIDSPYNTYKYPGLPPGPINNPEVTAIDGVLNAESHKYIFMCAKEDFSGYHNFAVTLAQHNKNARLYQAALNAQKVYR
jgi:UPF0755 protein